MLSAVLVKRELILNGLTCAHCAETIGEVVKNINGVESSNMNFISKKLTLEIDSSYNEEEIIKEVFSTIDSIEPGLDIQVVNKKLKLNNKKEIMLNGLTCAHCAEVIGDKVKYLEGIQSSNLNFVNKKLTLELNSQKNEDKIIENVIDLIDSIEPGLDIKVLGNQNKSYIRKEITLGGLNCAHCAEVIGNKVSELDGVKNSNLNFVNKKLSVEVEDLNKEVVIKNIINIINDTEPGLDIQIEGAKKK